MLDELLHVQVLTHISASGGEALSSERYSDREDEHIELKGIDVVLSSTDKRPHNHSFGLLNANVGDSVFVVIVRYTTGDTFGNSYGEVAVLDVFKTLADAEGLVEAIKANIETKEWRFVYMDREYYAGAWQGYFERFEHAEIHKKTILRDSDGFNLPNGYLYFE